MRPNRRRTSGKAAWGRVLGAGVAMGVVIKFPDERIAAGERSERGVGATIVILPVVRIERGTDGPSGGLEPGASTPGRKRRRRSR